MLSAFLLLSLSMLRYQGSFRAFELCIGACLCVGFAQAFGEATLMGYLKGLPSDLVMTFGAGTALAGFSDVFTALFLNALGVAYGRVTPPSH
jgi:hypothetical protein